MSRQCMPEPPRGQRFKGVENFLRRIAFNLGNTPSQTEVKIISCIPIDVTDLQHKILALERQLEGMKKGNGSKVGPHPGGGGSGVVAGVGKPGGGGSVGGGSMGGKPSAGPNAGRSAVYAATHAGGPHRTCPTPRSAYIPPALHPAAMPTTPTTTSRTPSCASSRQKKSSVSFDYTSGSQHVQRGSEQRNGDSALDLEEDRDDVRGASSGGADRLRDLRSTKKCRVDKKKDKWKTQYVYHAQITDSPFNRYRNSSEYASRGQPPPAPPPPPAGPRNTISRAYLAAVVRKQYQPDRVNMLSDASQFSTPVCRDSPAAPPAQPAAPPAPPALHVCSCCSVPFHNIDHPLRTSDDLFSTPPLACTSPVNTMYYDSSLYDLVPVREKPATARNEEDQFKKKDLKCQEHHTCTWPRRCPARPRLQPYVINHHSVAARASRKAGCKRKLPLRPLAGISAKRKYFESHMDLETSNTCSFVCGGVYAKPTAGSRRTHRTSTSEPRTEPKLVLMKNAECLAISVNNTECQTASSKSVQLEPPPPPDEPPDDDRTEETLNQIKTILQTVLAEVKTNTLAKPVAAVKSHRDAVAQKGQSQNNIQTCSSIMNSFNYSPYNMYGQSCSRTLPPQLYYPGGGCPAMRCVQNYPLFIHTTGRQCACCYRGVPGQLVAAAVARSAARHAAATTAATNTDSAARQQGKETDTLIKEIYKSIELNMDYPRKDTSTSGGEELKPMFNKSPKIEFKYIPSKPSSMASRRTTKGASSVVTRHEQTSVAQSTHTEQTSRTVNTTFTSDVVSNAASMRSRYAATSPSDRTRLDKYIQLARESTLSKLTTRPHSRAVSTYTPERPDYFDYDYDYDYDTDVTDTPDSPESPYSSPVTPYSSPMAPYSPSPESPDSPDTATADESDDTIVPILRQEPARQKPKSRGLFSTMAKLFKGRKRRQRSVSDPDSRGRARGDESASDSDDYETVCSRQSRPPARRTRRVTYARDRSYKRRTHSKLATHPRYYAQPQAPRGTKSPNMEQEYRRQWNEKLAFHGNQRRYSSDQPPTRSTRRSHERRRSPYWQTYETHPASVVTRDPTPDDNRFTSEETAPEIDQPAENRSATKRMAWLKKNKLLRCGESRLFKCGKQWKKFMLES